MPTNPWPSEWMRGLLTLAVLRVLAEGPTYGYEIAARLEAGGLGVVKGGSLYPLLSRLEVAGHVETQWREGQGGPGRKYFQLTRQGHDEFRRQSEQWQAFSATTTDFLTNTTRVMNHEDRRDHRPLVRRDGHRAAASRSAG